MVLHFFCIQIFFFKSTYRPSWFSDQKGKQIFYFLGLVSDKTDILNNYGLIENYLIFQKVTTWFSQVSIIKAFTIWLG